MPFDFRVPPPPLGHHISLLWAWRGVAKPGVMERLMPDGEPALIVNLKDDRIRLYDKDTLALSAHMSGSVLVGVQTQPMVIDGEEQESVFGVQFRAGGAYPFLGGMPAGETTNLHVDLDDLWRGNGFRERLLECESPDAMFDAAEVFFLGLLRNQRARHAAVDYAIAEIAHSPQAQTIADLTGATGLSSRRFIQLFREQAGITPKIFCRILRFQRMIEAVHRKPKVDWAQVALDGGYHDQSHFIRDFREFAGVTPSNYLANSNEHKNHVLAV